MVVKVAGKFSHLILVTLTENNCCEYLLKNNHQNVIEGLVNIC